MDFLEPTQRLDSTEDEASSVSESSKVEEQYCGFLKVAGEEFKLVIGDNFIGRDPSQCQVVLASQVVRFFVRF